ncbi:MAG: hypothetical protein ILP18_08475 [Treponema sp.]|nr:hypothetical protein [Treponema sp.]
MTKAKRSIASFMLAVAVLSGYGTTTVAAAPISTDSSDRPLPPPGDSMGGPMGGPGGMAPAGKPEKYDAATSYSSDKSVSGKKFSSWGKDENAVLVTGGATVSLDDANITRKSATSKGGDSSSFYGTGAAALVTDGRLNIQDSAITTDAKGGAGVFAYGNGDAYVSYTTISTKKDTSGGIHVAGGGKLYAENVTVETNGESSAAIRSDRGGGTIVVDGGSYTSNGVGSPAIYSTADITVRGAKLTANGSEAICIEGLNSIRLFDCNLTGNMGDLSQNDCTWNVILYQSMSGDSQIGNSTFEMQGGKLTARHGGMFYSTNTESTFILKNVEIENSGANNFFLKVTGNMNQRGWGRSGENGADTKFTAIQQYMEGDVIYDSISNLNFFMTEGSSFIGRFVDDEKAAGNGGNGTANLSIDSTSSWVVTGDSRLTRLSCSGRIKDRNGNTVSIVGTDGRRYVEGSSSYTITVTSYDTAGDVSSASTASSFADTWPSDVSSL